MTNTRQNLAGEVTLLRSKALDACVLAQESKANNGSSYSHLLARYVKAWEAYRKADMLLFEYDVAHDSEEG